MVLPIETLTLHHDLKTISKILTVSTQIRQAQIFGVIVFIHDMIQVVLLLPDTQEEREVSRLQVVP